MLVNGAKELINGLPIIGMYAEYGAYAEGGGPYFVPTLTDTIDDLLATKILYPIYSTEYSDGALKIISFIDSGDGEVFVGVNLMGQGNILIERTALDGVLKVAGKKICVSFTITAGVV